MASQGMHSAARLRSASAGAVSDARFPQHRAIPDWGARALLYLPLIATTVLAKIAISPLSPYITIAVPLLLVTPLLGILLGRMHFDGVRLALYLIAMSFLWIEQMLRGDSFSVPSMLLHSC